MPFWKRSRPVELSAAVTLTASIGIAMQSNFDIKWFPIAVEHLRAALQRDPALLELRNVRRAARRSFDHVRMARQKRQGDPGVARPPVPPRERVSQMP
jgi:hypothetical protein